MSKSSVWLTRNPSFGPPTYAPQVAPADEKQQRKRIPTEAEYAPFLEHEWRWSGRYKLMMALRHQSPALWEMPEGVMPARNGADIVFLVGDQLYQVHARFTQIKKHPTLFLTLVQPDVAYHTRLVCASAGGKISMNMFFQNERTTIREVAPALYRWASVQLRAVLDNLWRLYSLCLLAACFVRDTDYAVRVRAVVYESAGGAVAPYFSCLEWHPWTSLAFLISGKTPWKCNEQK